MDDVELYPKQDNSDYYLGTVSDVDRDLDFGAAQISDSSSKSLTDRIVDSGGLEAEGRMTQDGLEKAMSEGDTLYKIGAKTGKTTDAIRAVDTKRSPTSCSTGRYGFVDVNNVSDDGDSGCVYYIEKYDFTINEYYAAIAGVHSSAFEFSTECFSTGPMADAIYDQFNGKYFFT